MRVFKEIDSRSSTVKNGDDQGGALSEAKKAKRKKKLEARSLKASTSIEDNPQIVKREKPVKEFSDREIRDKLSAHLNKSNSATTMNKIKKEELLGSGFLDEEVVNKKLEIQKAKEAEAVKKAESLAASPNSNSEKTEIQKTTISVEKIEKPSDVGVNNPRDPMTASKLKSALDMGAFHFNPKEREVLSKILGDRA